MAAGNCSSYPLGFRFLPMDYELIIHLNNKIRNDPNLIDEIKVVDLYRKDPMTLTEMYPPLGKKEWYFFTTRNRKYPNGSRPDRTAGDGYWKATGEKKVYRDGRVVGFKKSLVFHVGKHRKSVKTNWIMHEYRVDDQSCRPKTDSMKLEEWVLCRIHDNGPKPKGDQDFPAEFDIQEFHAVMDINVSDHEPSNTHQDHDHDQVPSLEHVPDIDDQELRAPMNANPSDCVPWSLNHVIVSNTHQDRDQVPFLDHVPDYPEYGDDQEFRAVMEANLSDCVPPSLGHVLYHDQDPSLDDHVVSNAHQDPISIWDYLPANPQDNFFEYTNQQEEAEAVSSAHQQEEAQAVPNMLINKKKQQQSPC